MSDFVTHLIARAMGTAETIRPRVPALFESGEITQPARVGPSLEPVERRESAAERNELPQNKSRAEQTSVEVPHESGVKHQADVKEAATSPVTAAPGRPQPNRSSGAAKKLPRSELRAPDAQEKAPAPVIAAVAPPRRLDELQPPARARIAAAPEKPYQAVSGAFKAPAMAAPSGQANRQFRPETAAPAIARVRESPKASLESKAIPVFARQLMHSLNAKERAMTPPQQDPVVHVTIGRIEVRAMPQERQAKQDRRPQAVMSLDDYLRNRTKVAGR